MNKERRKQIAEVSEKMGNMKGEIESLMSTVEEIRSDEEDYKDNIPDNLRESERYTMAEDAIENLQQAYDQMDEVMGAIEEVESYLDEAAA